MKISSFSEAPTSTETSNDLRVLHYLGSKLRMLQPIRRAVADVLPTGGRVCDIFAGSGAVSLGLSRNWAVTAVDIQEYSRVLANGILNPPDNALADARALKQEATECALRRNLRTAFANLLRYERRCLSHAAAGQVTDLCELLEHGSLHAFTLRDGVLAPELEDLMQEVLERLRMREHLLGPQSVVTRHFGGVYFSWKQAIDLDALLGRVHSLDAHKRDHFLAAALSAASDVVSAVGKQFAQPLKPYDSEGRPKHHIVRQALRDRSMSVLDSFEAWIDRFSVLKRGGLQHQAIRSDFRDVLSDEAIEFDAVYADPPYTRDHYSRYYHVLETMSLRDNPEVSMTMIRGGGSLRVSRGVYRADRYQSPFCIKSQAAGAFEDLCRGVSNRRIPLIISYSPYIANTKNRPRLLTVDELLSISSRHYRKVEFRPVSGIAHNKFNLTKNNVEVGNHAEIVVSCLP